MSGHSKWATTKYRKGAQDKARAKVFAKCIRPVEVAAREGGGDLESNATLRTAYQKARAASVPLDTIEKAIKRGTGDLEGVRYESITYEGYGPGGVAVMVESLTDNRNRTGAEMRNLFNRNGGNMAEPGSVSWQFERKGIVTVPLDQDEDKVMEIAMEGGAEDLSSQRRGLGRHERPGRPGVRARVPSTTPASPQSRWTSRSSPPLWCPCPTSRRPRRSCGCSRRSTTTTTSRPCTPTPTSPTGCWPPSRAEMPWSTPSEAGRLRCERMFVLGSTRALSRCGYGLVARGEADGALQARAAGVIETDPAAPLPERLLILHTELRSLVSELPPDVVVVERVFFQVNAATAMSVGQASGLALAGGGRSRVARWPSTPPTRSSRRLVGYGAATKEQVQRMVAQVLGLARSDGPPDVADALALAVCHLTTVPLRRALDAALARGGPGEGGACSDRVAAGDRRAPDRPRARSSSTWAGVGLPGHRDAGHGRGAHGRAGIGTEATLFVHTHVREDAIVLYGFVHDDERRCFEVLLGLARRRARPGAGHHGVPLAGVPVHRRARGRPRHAVHRARASDARRRPGC